jgi:hypothetical protein
MEWCEFDAGEGMRRCISSPVSFPVEAGLHRGQQFSIGRLPGRHVQAAQLLGKNTRYNITVF